jgi:hypothetical protein
VAMADIFWLIIVLLFAQTIAHISKPEAAFLMSSWYISLDFEYSIGGVIF